MARKTNPVSPAKIGSEKAKTAGRAKDAAAKLPPIPYKKVGSSAETEKKRAATRANTERVEADRGANGVRYGFSVQQIKRAQENPQTGGGTVLPHSGVMGGGVRMSDQIVPLPTDNQVVERTVNRRPYNFAPTPDKNRNMGAGSPEQAALEQDAVKKALATPEGKAHFAKQSPEGQAILLRRAGLDKLEN